MLPKKGVMLLLSGLSAYLQDYATPFVFTCLPAGAATAPTTAHQAIFLSKEITPAHVFTQS